MTEDEARFALRAVRRKRLFLGLSIAGVTTAAALCAFYGVLWWRDPDFPIGPRMVIVLLVLLNARLNLRQYRYARLLAGLMAQAAR